MVAFRKSLLRQLQLLHTLYTIGDKWGICKKMGTANRKGAVIVQGIECQYLQIKNKYFRIVNFPNHNFELVECRIDFPFLPQIYLNNQKTLT